MLWTLFVLFLKVGALSFGGGYAVIPLIRHEAIAQGWLTEPEFARIAGIAGMSPGPVAANIAALLGFETAGAAGAIVAMTGILLPSLLIVGAAGASFRLLRRNPWWQAALYGLRPVVAAMIVAAAVRFVLPADSPFAPGWPTVATLLIGAGAFVALYKYKRHPLLVIALSGAAGVILI